MIKSIISQQLFKDSNKNQIILSVILMHVVILVV